MNTHSFNASLNKAKVFFVRVAEISIIETLGKVFPDVLNVSEKCRRRKKVRYLDLLTFCSSTAALPPRFCVCDPAVRFFNSRAAASTTETNAIYYLPTG
jgi:hypothetical protein